MICNQNLNEVISLAGLVHKSTCRSAYLSDMAFWMEGHGSCVSDRKIYMASMLTSNISPASFEFVISPRVLPMTKLTSHWCRWLAPFQQM